MNKYEISYWQDGEERIEILEAHTAEDALTIITFQASTIDRLGKSKLWNLQVESRKFVSNIKCVAPDPKINIKIKFPEKRSKKCEGLSCIRAIETFNEKDCIEAYDCDGGIKFIHNRIDCDFCFNCGHEIDEK